MGLFRYLLQYNFRDMVEFIRNEKKPPAPCSGSLEGSLKKRLILPAVKDPVISAFALLYLSVSDDVKKTSGRFFNLTTPEKPALASTRDTGVGAASKSWIKGKHGADDPKYDEQKQGRLDGEGAEGKVLRPSFRELAQTGRIHAGLYRPSSPEGFERDAMLQEKLPQGHVVDHCIATAACPPTAK